MRTRLLNYAFRGILMVLLLLSQTGCEEEIAPARQTDNAFSIYGVINPLADMQAIRVFQIDNLLELATPDPIDAAVQSTDLESGELIVWQDSVIQFPSLRFGHVYYAPFRAINGHRYRVEVTRSDGVFADVVARVPPVSEPEVRPHEVNGFFVTVPVLWRDAPNLIDIKVRYFTNVGTVTVDYNIDQDTTPDGQLVTINVRNDTRAVFQTATFLGVTDVILTTIEMSVVITAKDWTPPGGIFDADVFSEPGTFSNVQNGFGFVGAGYPATIHWTPEPGLIEDTGFADPGR